MVWIIKGADSKTGDEKTIQLSAPNEAEARAEARRRGFLVSTAERIDAARTIDYLSPIGARDSAEAPEEYESISKGAKTISAFASLCRVLGVLSIVVGVGGFILGITTNIGTSGAFVLILGIFYGVFFLIVAAILELLAGLSLAVREIAFNTRK